MFLFSLAKELKRTVREIERDMDAAELMEWVAYFKASDDDEAKRLHIEIDKERTDEEKASRLRAFLSTMKRKR